MENDITVAINMNKLKNNDNDKEERLNLVAISAETFVKETYCESNTHIHDKKVSPIILTCNEILTKFIHPEAVFKSYRLF